MSDRNNRPVFASPTSPIGVVTHPPATYTHTSNLSFVASVRTVEVFFCLEGLGAGNRPEVEAHPLPDAAAGGRGS